jgi:hypothetical protein
LRKPGSSALDRGAVEWHETVLADYAEKSKAVAGRNKTPTSVSLRLQEIEDRHLQCPR